MNNLDMAVFTFLIVLVGVAAWIFGWMTHALYVEFPKRKKDKK